MKSAKIVAENLKKLYGDRPGVVKIQEDLSNSVVVFFDRDELKTVFPSFYEGVKIIHFDLKQIMALSYNIIDLMRKKVDLSIPEYKKQFDVYYRSVELCHFLLEK